jgi:hypothetical protein
MQTTGQDGFTPIDSGHLSGAKYDSFTRQATIKFQNGYHYVVHNMSPEAYRDFMDAPSQGEHYHGRIKNDFKIERVK